MNIKTDIQEIIKATGGPPLESDAGIESLKDIVRNSLASLKDEIEKEEKERPCHIMIYLLTPDEEKHLPEEKKSGMIRFMFNGYSKELVDKMYTALDNGSMGTVSKVPIAFTQN